MTTPQRGAEVLFSIRFNPAKGPTLVAKNHRPKISLVAAFPIIFHSIIFILFSDANPPSMQQQRAPTRPTPYQSFPFLPLLRARAFPMVFHLNDPGKNKNPFINSFWSTPADCFCPRAPWVPSARTRTHHGPHLFSRHPIPHPPPSHSLFFFFFLSYPFFSFCAARNNTTAPLSKTHTSPLLTMSEEWQPYVDDYMTGKGNITCAAIMSYPDGAVVGQSPDFYPQAYTADTYDDAGNEIQIEVDECAGLIEAAGTDWAAAPAGGLRMNQKKYMWLGTGEETVEAYGVTIKYARAKSGANLSMCLAYSETAVLIAVADKSKGNDFAQCIADMCDLVAYLKSTGY
jgi:hypothetical protein